ncbi:MAG: type II secretion system F family protein [bacterium]|nr:type II secretion system F family protein [bacterium]
MPYYNCTFLNDEGRYIKKTFFSENKKHLWEHYGNADEKLLYVKRNWFKSELSIKIFSGKIPYFDFLRFNQKMITLLKSGVTFVRGLEIVTQNLKRGNLKEILIKTDQDIKNGIQISDAFSSPQIPFQKIYKASLLAGEKSGNLETILAQFNSYLEKIAGLRRKVISSMSYPVILFTFMIGMVLVILIYAIPKFSLFYQNFGAKLPPVTQALIDTGDFLQNNFLLITGCIFGFIFLIKSIEKLRRDIIIVDYVKTKIPYIGAIIVENSMTVFARTMAILIGGGIPVPEAAQISVETFSNRYFFSKVKDVPEKIREGNLLSDVLKEVKFIPPELLEVIKVGETSGNLTDVLNENADAFEQSIDAKINTLISMIEPIMIIVIGVVIALMLVSVYLPIFNTVNIVK